MITIRFKFVGHSFVELWVNRKWPISMMSIYLTCEKFAVILDQETSCWNGMLFGDRSNRQMKIVISVVLKLSSWFSGNGSWTEQCSLGLILGIGRWDRLWSPDWADRLTLDILVSSHSKIIASERDLGRVDVSCVSVIVTNKWILSFHINTHL